MKLQPLAIGWLKCYVDGTSFPHQCKVGLGASIRDSNDECVEVLKKKTWNKLFSLCEVEALSLNEALGWLKAQ